MEGIIFWIIIFSSLFLLYLFLKFLVKVFETVNIWEAIELLKQELIETNVTYIIKELPWKYNDFYWKNVIFYNVLNKKNIEKINISEESTKIRLHLVKSYINEVLEEEKKYEEEGKIKDTSSVSELKTLEEIENNLPGTVNKDDKNINEKLLLKVKLK